MRAGLKFIMIAVGLVLIGIAVAVILLAGPLEKLARGQAEARLSRIYGSKVTIGRTRFIPTSFGVQADDVVIQNPPGFAEAPAITCEHLLVLADPATLFSRQLEIRTVRIEGVEMHLRYEMGQGTNIGKLHDAAQESAGEVEIEKAPAEADTAGAPKAARRKVGLRQFECAGAKLIFSANLIPLASASLDIAPFTLDLEGQAVSVASVAGIILRSLIKESITLNGLLRPVSELLQEELSKETI